MSDADVLATCEEGQNYCLASSINWDPSVPPTVNRYCASAMDIEFSEISISRRKEKKYTCRTVMDDVKECFFVCTKGNALYPIGEKLCARRPKRGR